MSGDLPVVTPAEFAGVTGERTEDPAVAGVLLAAGTSSRFGGRNKLLAAVDGEPLVRRAARALEAADVEFAQLVAVVGHEAGRVEAALDGLDFEAVENPDYREGQATSLRRGIRAVRDADAAAFALGDMPFVRPESVEALVGAYRAGAGSALAAGFLGRRGNPVLFDARHFDALAAVGGDTGGRGILLGSDDAALVETADPGVLVDVDAPDDLRRLG